MIPLVKVILIAVVLAAIVIAVVVPTVLEITKKKDESSMSSQLT